MNDPMPTSGDKQGTESAAAFIELLAPSTADEPLFGRGPARVLVAPCGTGELASELTHDGLDVVGVDPNEEAIATASSRDSRTRFVADDIADVRLGNNTYDVVVMPDSAVNTFSPQRLQAVVRRLASYVYIEGYFVAGFATRTPDGGSGLADFDTACSLANLAPVRRYANWRQTPYLDDKEYVVTVHRLR